MASTPLCLTCMATAINEREIEVVIHGERRRVAATCTGRRPAVGQHALAVVDLEIVGARLVERARR